MPKAFKPALIACFGFLYNFSFAQNNTIDGHPARIMQRNVYELNVRQYTPEETVTAFEKSLLRLTQHDKNS